MYYFCFIFSDVVTKLATCIHTVCTEHAEPVMSVECTLAIPVLVNRQSLLKLREKIAI